MGSDQLLTAQENYRTLKAPNHLTGLDAADSVKSFICDSKRESQNVPTPIVRIDAYSELVTDASVGRKEWKKTRFNGPLFEDGCGRGASLTRFIAGDKTPSTQSRLLFESQDNLTSSTD